MVQHSRASQCLLLAQRILMAPYDVPIVHEIDKSLELALFHKTIPIIIRVLREWLL